MLIIVMALLLFMIFSSCPQPGYLPYKVPLKRGADEKFRRGKLSWSQITPYDWNEKCLTNEQQKERYEWLIYVEESLKHGYDPFKKYRRKDLYDDEYRQTLHVYVEPYNAPERK